MNDQANGGGLLLPDSGEKRPPPSGEERNWAMLCHLSGLLVLWIPFLSVLAPLAIWLWKSDDYPYLKEQGREAVNFQLTVFLIGCVFSILVFIFIGVALLWLLGLFDLVMVIMAVMQVKEGRDFRYPFNWRLIQ